MNQKKDSASFFIYTTRNPGAHILLSRVSPRWVQVNNTGLEIAMALDSGEPPDAVAGRISTGYHIAREQAVADVMAVNSMLLEKGLIAGRRKPEKPVRRPVLDSLYLHVTTRCNLSCLQCYVDCGRKTGARDIPVKKALSLIDELVACRGSSVTISGGEPLMHPDIRIILNHAAGNLKIRLLTNGTKIDRDMARFLADRDIDIQISIDGPDALLNDSIRGKGTYDKILFAVNLLQSAGLGSRLIFCTTIMEQNLHRLNDIIALAARLGVPNVRFLPLRNIGAAHHHWESVGSKIHIRDHEVFYRHVSDIEQKLRHETDISCGLSGFMLEIPEGFDDGIWCSVGRHLVIDAKGDVFPCVLLMTGEFHLGNIYKTGLCEMMESRAMKQVRDILVRRRYEIEKCASCDFQNLCQAGCMGQASDNKGTIRNVDDYCRYRYERYCRAFDTISKKDGAA